MALVKEVKEPKKVKLTPLTPEQEQSNKIILDMANSDKKKKDVMLMNISELEKHTAYLKKNISELHQEYETRKRLVDSINLGIGGAQARLSMLQAEFDSKNVKLVAEFNKKMTDVDSSDKVLRKLILENSETKRINDIERAKLAEYRQFCDRELNEMRRALSQNNSEWSRREADILEREVKLKDEKLVFEAEKEALAPEALRITSIKNENILLLQQLERNRINIENLRLSVENDKEKIESERKLMKESLKHKEGVFANEDARLRKWEQDLKDYDLEVRARAAEADKIIRREQLTKKVASNTK